MTDMKVMQRMDKGWVPFEAKLFWNTSGGEGGPPTEKERQQCYRNRVRNGDDCGWCEAQINRAQLRGDHQQEAEWILKAACADLAGAREFLSHLPMRTRSGWLSGGCYDRNMKGKVKRLVEYKFEQ